MQKHFNYFLKNLCCSEKTSHTSICIGKRGDFSFFRSTLVKTVESPNYYISRSWDIFNMIVTLTVQYPVTVPLSQILSQFESLLLRDISNLLDLYFCVYFV